MIDFLVNDIMMPMLIFFHNITGSYGWAIIFLTLAVKTALMPLTFQSMRSSLEMQRLQPKMKELQVKYKDKPEIYNKKVMEFYKENKVNPLGGCLPLIIQMPFFIGLYSTFIGTEFKKLIDAGNEPSFLFISDLTRIGISHNGLYFWDNLLLIILFGVTTFISQKMMITNPDDPMQKQMLYMMPPMITVMFIFVPVPSGALLYIVVSNLITMIQNLFIINKRKNQLANDINLATDTSVSASENAKISGSAKNPINLNKENDEENLSPVLVSEEKSKRAKKKKKKNRKN